MNPVVHFEMPAADRTRMANFYSKAFGWKTQMLDEKMGNYVLATTTEVDEKGRPKTPGAINGGFYPVNPGTPLPPPHIVISVDDLKEAMKNVSSNGGTVHGEPVEIPGIGHYVAISDTEGNRVALLQPMMR